MSDKVFINAEMRFKARSDTKINWETTNPVLLSGEAGVVTDGSETKKIKFGDGVTPWNELGYWKGPKGETGPQGEKGDSYVLTVTDKQEIADLLKPQVITFVNGDILILADNTEYRTDEEITSLTVIYPETDFICSLNFTLASAGNITITLPESKYIGGVPSFANGETWELNIRDGVVVGGLVE